MPWTGLSEWLSENVLVLVFLASLFGALSVMAGLLAGYAGHLEAVGAQIAAAKANERAAIANERPAEAEKGAAEANERAVILYKSMKLRQLTSEQVSKIASALLGNIPPLTILRTKDPEVGNFAVDILINLSKAGLPLTIEDKLVDAVYFGFSDAPLILYLSDPSYGIVISKAFNDAGIPLEWDTKSLTQKFWCRRWGRDSPPPRWLGGFDSGCGRKRIGRPTDSRGWPFPAI